VRNLTISSDGASAPIDISHDCIGSADVFGAQENSTVAGDPDDSIGSIRNLVCGSGSGASFRPRSILHRRALLSRSESTCLNVHKADLAGVFEFDRIHHE
jgi:hypothetical protein